MSAFELIATTSGLDWVAIGTVVAAAVAVATYIGTQDRAARARRRDRWRTQDRLSGYTDDAGRHPGGLDLIFGWTDENGRNPGLVERMEDLEDWQDAHDAQHSRER